MEKIISWMISAFIDTSTSLHSYEWEGYPIEEVNDLLSKVHDILDKAIY